MEVEEAQEDVNAARAVRRKDVLGSAKNPIDCTLPDPLYHFIDLTQQ